MSKKSEKVSELAAQIAASEINKLPQLLLKLKEITANASEDEDLLNEVCADILFYKLFPLLIGILKQDFSKFDEKWKFAANLCDTLRSVAICMASSKIEFERYSSLLPKCVNNILLLAHNMQQSFEMLDGKKERSNMLKNFNQVLNNLLIIVEVYKHLVSSVIGCSWLHEMLINSSDDADGTYVPLVTLLCRFCEISDDLKSIKKKSVETILDELVYRLSMSQKNLIAEISLKCIFNFVEQDQAILNVVKSRYKGLLTLIKKFEDTSSNSEARNLEILLKEGSLQSAYQQKRNAAAISIQSYYRGYRSRKMLKDINAAFSKFQKIYRHRVAERDEEKLRVLQSFELKQMKAIKRKQEMRKSKQRQMEVLTLIPASQVKAYFQTEQNAAARKIQATWRGYRCRKRYSSVKIDLLQHRAAILIQTRVRAWLEKRKIASHQMMKRINVTDEESETYQKIVDEWQASHGVAVKSREEQENLFKKSQKLLQEYYSTLPYIQRSLEHCQNLSSQIEVISDLIGRSTLDHFNEDEIRLFKSHSAHISADAKSQHQEALKLAREPAWKHIIINS